MMIKSLVVGLALVIAAGAAPAQTKKELVAKLMQVQQAGIEGVGRALAGQVSQRALQAAAQAMPRVAADKREAVGRDIQADVKKFHDEIEPILRERALRVAPALATIYEERLTEDELKQVIAWLESPTSKKFGQIDRELGNTLAERVVAESSTVVDERLKVLESVIAKRLGVAPPNAPARAASGAAPKK